MRTDHLQSSGSIPLGFCGIDTACQPKHYSEPLVGQAIRDILNDKSLNLTREDIWVQTKYTSVDGQD